MEKNVYRFILHFVIKQCFAFLMLFLGSLAFTADIICWPYLFGKFIDVLALFQEERAKAWSFLVPILQQAVILLVGVAIALRTRHFLQTRVFPRLEADIRMTMFDHIQCHSPKYFADNFPGSLANKISDMTTEVTMIFEHLLFFFPAMMTVIFSLIILWNIHSALAFIFFGWLVLCAVMCGIFVPKCVRCAREHGTLRTFLAGKIVDSLTNYFSVNLFFRFKQEKERIVPVQEEERQAHSTAQRYVAWLFTGLSGTLLLGVFGLNAFMIASWFHGDLSTGEAVQIFNMIWGVMSAVWWCCEVMPAFFQSIGIATQAFSVMQDVNDVQDLLDAKELVVSQGDIVFDQVDFHYGKRQLFTKQTLHIRAGEKVGLVGHSGAGKSTLLSLIVRLRTPSHGRILIDGQDIAHVTCASLRRQVVVIPQDCQLFHRSLFENIQYGRPEALHEEVFLAAKKAHADEFIIHMSDGYDTCVGDRGAKLSGGERQRIAIARGFLANAHILLLDEATSSLDSHTELLIQESLQKLMEKKTTIIIAHRLSTLVQMDRILVFDQGKIIEEGTHQELLAKKGAYTKLWEMQAGGFL